MAQLIFDVKQVNPKARVAVKLVSTLGVGTIAAGVASLSGGDQISQTGGEVVGKKYLVTFTVVTTNGGDLGVYSSDNAFLAYIRVAVNGYK